MQLYDWCVNPDSSPASAQVHSVDENGEQVQVVAIFYDVENVHYQIEAESMSERLNGRE